MESQSNSDTPCNNLYSEEMLNLANNQVDEVISSALHSLTRILSSPCISLTPTTSSSSLPSLSFPNTSISTPNRSLQPNISIRCRSSSRNNRREREVPIHHTIPRCSLPATKNDLVQYQSHLVSSHKPTHARLPILAQRSQQYLNRPWSTKIDKQRHHLLSVQNFVNELIEQSIRAALLQIDYQNLTDENTSIYEDDASCLLFDCSPSYIPIERFQTINTYADQLVHSTIEQSIEEVSLSTEDIVEYFSDRLTESAISDALSTITGDQTYSQSLLTDDEKHSRKSKKRSAGTIRLMNNENSDCQTNFFQQIRHRSSSAFRSLTNSYSRRDTLDSVVNNLAEQIYTDSFEELRRILTKTYNE